MLGGRFGVLLRCGQAILLICYAQAHAAANRLVQTFKFDLLSFLSLLLCLISKQVDRLVTLLMCRCCLCGCGFLVSLVCLVLWLCLWVRLLLFCLLCLFLLCLFPLCLHMLSRCLLRLQRLYNSFGYQPFLVCFLLLGLHCCNRLCHLHLGRCFQPRCFHGCLLCVFECNVLWRQMRLSVRDLCEALPHPLLAADKAGALSVINVLRVSIAFYEHSAIYTREKEPDQRQG
mmetsp:Transcript_135724/g.235882  ORF Transcript_135724/g.235882 Transcript_135724/m.235882 type:complete len:230 (+) Transcript_135724:550-1239(+)